MKILLAIASPFFAFATMAAPSVVGTWMTDCTPSDLNTSQTIQHTFYPENGRLLTRHAIYGGQNCVLPLQAVLTQGRYKVGGEFGEGWVLDLENERGERSHTIFQIEGDDLFFGAGSAQSEDRPDELNLDVPFRRKQ